VLGLTRRAALGAAAVGVLATLAVTRLPQLLSPQLFACGDEALVGIMTEDLLAGRRLPIFLYGQSYALAVPELVGTAVSVQLLGASSVALKTGGLLVWGIGLALFMGALGRLAGGRAAVVGGAALVLMPAWGRVSLMYSGAFLVSGLCLWLAARMRARQEVAGPVAFSVLGAALAATYFVHPLWFAAVVPLVLVACARSATIRSGTAALAGGAVLSGLVLAAGEGAEHWSPSPFASPDVVAAVLDLPRRLFIMLGGHYFLSWTIPMGPLARAATIVWGVLLVAAIGLALLGGRHGPLVLGCLASMLVTLVCAVLIDNEFFGFRYLLPLTVPLACLVAVAAEQVSAQRGVAGALAAIGVGLVVVVVSAAGLAELGRVSPRGYLRDAQPPESESLATLLAHLDRHGIHHVYSTDAMLQWNVMFASARRVQARWLPSTDRVPEYPRAVDRAALAGEPVAIIGRLEDQGGWTLERLAAGGRQAVRLVTVAPHYFIVLEPTVADLENVGFRLNRPPAADDAGLDQPPRRRAPQKMPAATRPRALAAHAGRS